MLYLIEELTGSSTVTETFMIFSLNCFCGSVVPDYDCDVNMTKKPNG
jgi:hypothetical protein